MKISNVPFEADEADLRAIFEKYGTVHLATMGTWKHESYAGMPEGSFSLKMTTTPYTFLCATGGVQDASPRNIRRATTDM